MVLRSSAWSLPWEKGILMMLSTPCGVDFANTLLYHLKALQLSFFPFFLLSFPTLSKGYNTMFPDSIPLQRDVTPARLVEPVQKCVHGEFTRENMLLAAFIRQG